MSESNDQAFIRRAVRISIIASAAAVALLAILWILKSALTPLAVSFVVAYLLNPIICWFGARRIPRPLAIFVFLALVAAALSVGILLLVPTLQNELTILATRFPDYFATMTQSLLHFATVTLGFDVPTSWSETITSLRSDSSQIILQITQKFVERSLGWLTGTLGALASFLIIPVLSFYFLVEFDRLNDKILRCIPPRYQDYIRQRATQVNDIVAGFLRGQLTICAILAILYAVGFSLIGIDFAVVIGLVGGALAIVPYLGNGLAVALASLVSLLKFGFDIHLALVLGWYAIVQFLEGFVLTPKIVGKSLGLHPVSVIIALLIGADLLGFLGLLIAVPAAAVIKVFVQEALAIYFHSEVYRGHTPPQTPSVE